MSNIAVRRIIQTSKMEESQLRAKESIMQETNVNYDEKETEFATNELLDDQKDTASIYMQELEIEYCSSKVNKFRQSFTSWDTQATLSHFLYSFGDAFVHFMIAVRMHYIGLSKDEIVTVMSAGGLVGLSRMFPSYIIDRFDFNRIEAGGVFCLLIGLTTQISVTFTFPLTLAYFVAFGFLQCKLHSIILKFKSHINLIHVMI